MKHRSRFAVLIATVAFAAACTQSQAPTSPSPAASLNNDGVGTPGSHSWATISQSSRSPVFDWECLTTGAGCSILPLPSGRGSLSPEAPANLSFTVSGSTVILTWSPPGPGSTVDTYIVEAGSVPGSSNIIVFNIGSNATSFTATNVPAGTYHVRVRGANADGLGAVSNEVAISVGSAPCVPSEPPALSGSASGSTVTLNWSGVSGATSFVVEAGSGPGASNIVVFDTGNANTSYVATNVPNGTYYVRARVRTACGTSGVSNEIVITVGSAAPPSGALTGLWVGTITPTVGGSRRPAVNVQVDFSHSGTSLIGVVRGRTEAEAITFTLTQRANNPAFFDGALRFFGARLGGQTCGPGTHTGALQVFTGGFISMAGTFTSGPAGNCASEDEQVQLVKQ